MALLDHLLGDPARLPLPGLARGVRRGSEGFAIRCIRALGERSDALEVLPLLLPLLSDERAGLRRAAARAAGNLAHPHAGGPLATAATAERTEEGTLALAIARVRCGAPAAPLAAALARFDERTLDTPGGPRAPAAVAGNAPLADRLWQALGTPPGTILPRAALRATHLSALGGSSAAPRTMDTVQGLAALGHPDDPPMLRARLGSAGRRGEHALLVAFGLSGDPLQARPLRDALRATDVDPGRGFAQRRIAASGLGRLGLRLCVPWIVRALEDEAADFEGRPGAGLGIQYPVRTNLLWALGEIASPDGIPALIDHLDDTHGSALGGFYLPAMDALVKIGAPAFPALRAAVGAASELGAAHAVSVLVAGGQDVAAWRNDRRPAVRRAALAPPLPG